jgi:glycosyltransferase involved in cell wall biosynthesis
MTGARSERPGPAGGPPLRVVVLVPGAAFFASSIVRVEQYREHFERANVAVQVLDWFHPFERRNLPRLSGPTRSRTALARLGWRLLLRTVHAAHTARQSVRLLFAAGRADVVVIQWLPPPRWLTRLLTRRTRRLVFDFDDAVFLEYPARAREIVGRAWRVLAGSHYNLAYAEALNPAGSVLVPSPVPIERYGPVARAQDAPAPGGGQPVRIGWVGGSSTARYLTLLERPLRALRSRGYDVELMIAGHRERVDLLPAVHGLRMTAVPAYGAAELPGLVNSVDIGVMPLVDADWERGKCAMKALLHMAAGQPVVATPVGEAVHVVVDGITGFLCDHPSEWESALARLIDQPALRERMGRAGRAVIEARYSTDVCFALWERHVLAPARADLPENARSG